jgi:hypothetical protein
MGCKTCRGSGFVQLGDCPDCSGQSNKTSSGVLTVLTLTPYEAAVLRTACGWIGGHPDGPRGAMDRISSMLQQANIRPFKCRAMGSLSLEPGEPA